jgi:anti-anti-sigma factor
MNLSSERVGKAVIVRVGEAKLTYQILSTFADAVTKLLAAGEKRVIIDLSRVVYVDSATIGCLMDLYRQAGKLGGAIKLAGVQKRVETMLTMTGAHNFIELHADEAGAAGSFGE